MRTVTIENTIEFVTKETINGTIEAEILNISISKLVQKRNNDSKEAIQLYKKFGFVGEKLASKNYRFSKDIQVSDNKKDATNALNSLKKEYGFGFNSNLLSVFYGKN